VNKRYYLKLGDLFSASLGKYRRITATFVIPGLTRNPAHPYD